MSITKIVITGGPCSGKTTALNWIQNAFSERGYKVLFCPETATALISGGVAPWTCGENVEYQKVQMYLQREKENVFVQAASTMKDEKILIICDRGQMDNKAYCTDEEFRICLDYLKESEDDLRLNYDAVFHLVTAAKGAKDFYITSNNDARIETVEVAIDLDDKVIDAWTGHPNLKIIDNSIGFEDKMRHLISEMSAFLEEREAYEIKKKFLIEHPDVEKIESFPDFDKVEIIETYLNSNNDDEVWVRKQIYKNDITFFESRKQKTNDSDEIVVERRLREKEYNERLMNTDTSKDVIVKNQYRANLNNQHFEIDIYPISKKNAVLKVELTDPNEEICMPKEITVIKEITD